MLSQPGRRVLQGVERKEGGRQCQRHQQPGKPRNRRGIGQRTGGRQGGKQKTHRREGGQCGRPLPAQGRNPPCLAVARAAGVRPQERGHQPERQPAACRQCGRRVEQQNQGQRRPPAAPGRSRAAQTPSCRNGGNHQHRSQGGDGKPGQAAVNQGRRRTRRQHPNARPPRRGGQKEQQAFHQPGGQQGHHADM